MSVAQPERFRVLLVEDDEDDYGLTLEMLGAQTRAVFEVEWCSDYNDGLRAIREQRHDVYLIDYRLGGPTGLELVREGFASRPFAPVIMLTGVAAYEIDLAASALGVTDYLIKQDLDPASLERSIRYAISHQKAIDLSRSEERYALAVRAANDGIWDWDLVTDRIYLSPRWSEILGQPEQARDASPSAWFDLVHAEDLAQLHRSIDAHLAARTAHLEFEHRMLHADGTSRWVLVRGLAIRNDNGEPTRMAGSLSDITDRQTALLQLEHDAMHDTLTGLPNRTLFVDRVNQVLQRSFREPTVGCAVLFFDVDDFKLVNDSLSHSVGDDLLIGLGRRVQAAVRPGDTVARLSGDEFTVLLDNVRDANEARVVADRILHSLERPFTIDGNELFVSISIGISLSDAELSAADLVRNADNAMYEAKRRGRARSAVFDRGMHRRVADRLAQETALRHIVERSLIRVHYQPIVDLASGSISALEALARWPEGRTTVAPIEFIALAEEINVIGALGHHVMRTAFTTLAGWRAEGIATAELCMSVNLSGRQLDDRGLAAQVSAAIDAADLPPEVVRLEITESTLMREVERTQRVFSEICGAGVGLHLDDFGTGYSSLTVLRQLPIDAIKIDRSFVATMSEEDTGSDIIVRSIVALAHSLGLPVIAEGIESTAHLGRLRSLGCDFGQGYLFSKPVSAENMRHLLAGWEPHGRAGNGTHMPRRAAR